MKCMNYSSSFSNILMFPSCSRRVAMYKLFNVSENSQNCTNWEQNISIKSCRENHLKISIAISRGVWYFIMHTYIHSRYTFVYSTTSRKCLQTWSKLYHIIMFSKYFSRISTYSSNWPHLHFFPIYSLMQHKNFYLFKLYSILYCFFHCIKFSDINLQKAFSNLV